VSEDTEQGGDEDEPDELASRRTAIPRMTPISFGGRGPESANVKKNGDHDGGGGADAPGAGEAADRCSLRFAGPVVVLLGQGEQEDGVVHRERGSAALA
jgi:hypothetical protein